MRLDPIILSSAGDALIVSRCNQNPSYFFQIMADPLSQKEIASQPPVMSDDHSELAPLLPIPNRTVKRLCADDSVHTYVKVGHRQTPLKQKAQPCVGLFALWV